MMVCNSVGNCIMDLGKIIAVKKDVGMELHLFNVLLYGIIPVLPAIYILRWNTLSCRILNCSKWE